MQYRDRFFESPLAEETVGAVQADFGRQPFVDVLEEPERLSCHSGSVEKDSVLCSLGIGCWPLLTDIAQLRVNDWRQNSKAHRFVSRPPANVGKPKSIRSRDLGYLYLGHAKPNATRVSVSDVFLALVNDSVEVVVVGVHSGCSFYIV
jgi:hypothetical protein